MEFGHFYPSIGQPSKLARYCPICGHKFEIPEEMKEFFENEDD